MYRPGRDDAADPFFAEALKMVSDDPALGQWLVHEQEFDRVFGGKIEAALVPTELKARIIASRQKQTVVPFDWKRWVPLAAAAVLLVAMGILVARGSLGSRRRVADMRNEMVSFIKLTPPLELESADLNRIEKFIAAAAAPAADSIPPGLAQLDPVGCRVLAFREHKVTLICFKRGGGRLAHLFVIDRSALEKLPSSGVPTFEQEGDWMTAAWQDADHAYLLAAQGDRASVERYFKRL
jgi:hypothetical protein